MPHAPMDDGTGTVAPDRRRAWRVAPILAALFLGCVAGLFSMPLDLYDEPLLVLGGRLVRAGRLPYQDFYTHYGPLGYDLISWFIPIGNPGVAYRMAQSSALLVLAALTMLLWKRCRFGAQTWTAAVLTGFSYLTLATALAYPHFLAYLLALAGVGLVLLAECVRSSGSKMALRIAAGACIAFAGLVRPAFGIYGSLGMAAFLAAVEPAPRAARRAAQVLGATGATFALTWLLAYRRISVADAYFATIAIPARLAANSSRFVLPSLASTALPRAAPLLLGALHLAAVFALATIGAILSPHRAGRRVGLVGVAAAALLVVALGSSRNPGRDASWGAAVLLAIAFATWRLTRGEPGSSPPLRGSALCGLTAVAFLHYYLARADPAHLAATLGLAAAGALLALPSFSWRGRTATFALLVIALRSPNLGVGGSLLGNIGRAPTTPSVSTARGFWARWPASTFPTEAVAAVAAADRGADRSSRFVAVASDHASSEGSAVVLFLLSTRLPYTKWYAYDPGVQTSPFVQSQMVQELESSESRTAVVWSTRSFGGREREPGAPPTSPLDRRLLELYPVAAARFGGLLLRVR